MMTEIEIQQKLDELANLRAAVDLVTMEKNEAIRSIMTPEIQAQLKDIELEFLDKAAVAQEKADALEAEVKAAVIAHGATVKSQFYQAVWNKGKTTWDNKALDVFLQEHPGHILGQWRKVGEPSVSLRKV